MTSVAGRPETSPGGDQTRVAAAVARLRETFDTGRTRPVEWRVSQLRNLLRLLEEREAEVVEALTADLGRSAQEAWFGDVAPTRGEVRYALRHVRRWAKVERASVPIALLPGKAAVRYEPLGVVLVISPWNYPFYLSFAPMVGALAAGNCVVVKPSELAPASSAVIADLVPRYLDRDAVAVVEGDARTSHELIAARFDHVFFTGGTEIGRKVMEAAAPHLTPVTLELGGKNPVIVTRHADLEVAARRIVSGKLLNSGQTCLAPDYVLVEEPVKKALIDELRAAITQSRAGAPAMQPIVNERQYRRLAAYLDERSGDVVVGGGHEGMSVEPTIVVDPDLSSSLMQSEIFGPILPVLGVSSLEAAIAFVNARQKPLAAYVFSDDSAEQERVFTEVPAGGVVANQTVMHVLAPQLPFGGVGDSGIGTYHGRWGFERFSHRKATLAARSRPDLRFLHPPYSRWTEKLLRRLT